MTDSWSVTPPSPQEFPHSATDGVRALLDKIDRQKRELEEMRNNLLSTSGISVTPEGMIVNSSMQVDGELLVTGATRIEGTLSLPAGIIDNEALANPVTFASDRDTSAGFGIGTARGAYHTASVVTVPAGFTKAQVTSIAACEVGNSTAGTQYVYLSVRASTSTGAFQFSGSQQVTLAAGFWGSIIVPMMWAVSGLSGGDTITTRAEIWSSAAIAANVDHWVDTEMTATLSR